MTTTSSFMSTVLALATPVAASLLSCLLLMSTSGCWVALVHYDPLERNNRIRARS